MTELINRDDSLNQGRVKLNEGIKASERAENKSDEALGKANQSLSQSTSTQEQLNQVVINGDSSVEAAQARVDAEGQTYQTLKERLDAKETQTTAQLAQKANQTALEVEKARINNLTANAGDVTNNAELLDIRVGYDGITYTTAGEAVRQTIGAYMTLENESWVV